MSAKAITYIRFSTGKQIHGSTTQRQRQMISDWLNAHSEIELSSLSAVDEGRSGFSGAHLNHGLGKIVAAIEENLIKSGDYILIEALDRLGRLPPLDMLNLLQKIVGADVNIVTLEDNQTYSKESLNNNVGSMFILVGKIQQAHEYSKNLSRRIKSSWTARREKAKRGDTFKIAGSWWLYSSGKIIEKRGEIVKYCIDLYLKGYGFTKILELSSQHYSEMKNKHDRTIKRWFFQKSLVGIWQTEDEDIENAFDALIDTKKFYQLQSELKRRQTTPAPAGRWKLSGLVICKKCEKSFCFRRAVQNNVLSVYCNCVQFVRTKRCENSKTWAYQILLYIFESHLPEQLTSSVWQDQKSEEIEKLNVLKEQKNEIDSQIDKLLDLLISMQESTNIKNKIENLNNKKKEIESDINNVELILMSNSHDSTINFNNMIENANADIEEYLNDDIALREQLKRTNYRIKIENDIAYVNVGASQNEQFKNISNSKRYSCFYVQHTIPEHFLLDENDEEVLIEERKEYLAINKIGLITRADSLDNLKDKLENKKKNNDESVEFNISEIK